MAVIQSLYDTDRGTKTSTSSGRGIQPLIGAESPILERKRQPAQAQAPQVKKVEISQPKKGGKVVEEGKKFAVRTAVSFADLVTESLDFATNFIVDNPIFTAPQKLAVKTTEKVFGKESKISKKQKEEINKWQKIYKTTAAKPKQAVDKIQEKEFIKPSEAWSKAPLKEKLTKRLGETVSVLGPSIIPSFFLYAINPVLGVATTVGSTANDVRVDAIKNGVPEEKAERLGLGTGILVGALDRIVPDELFSGAQKGKFISGFARRIIPISLKEAGTEIAQENLQIAAEATFRKDLSWDEVKTRNAMAGLGGLLGGAGATTVIGTINQSFSQEILLDQTPEAKGEKAPSVIEPLVPEETKVVKVSEEPKIGKKLKVAKPEPKVEKKGAQQPLGDAGKVVTPKPKVVKPKKRVVKVPKKQLPVGEGAKKLSRLEARVTESLEKAPDEVKGLSTFNQMNKKEQIGKAVRYVTESPDEALAVLRGDKEAPTGLLNNSIYVAMEQQARGDYQLARKLATLASTRAGQEISILTELDPESPVKLMKDVVDIRAEKFKQRFKSKTVKQAQENVVKDIKKKVKVPSKYDWGRFINSIEC